MKQLRFINRLAQLTPVTVAVLNDGEALTFGEVYVVNDEIAAALLANPADWKLVETEPTRSEAAPSPTGGASAKARRHAHRASAAASAKQEDTP